MKKMTFMFLAMISWVLLMGASFGPQVTVHSDMLAVRAKEVPLSEVLAAISDQAKVKFTVVGEGKVDEVLISDDFAGLPLERGIARLLKGLSYSLIADKAGVLRKVIILGRGTSGGSTRGDTSAMLENRPEAESVGDRMAEASTAAMLENRPVAESHEASFESETADDRLAEAITAAKAAQNPEEQVNALLKLGDYQDNRTLEALMPALQSPHTEVRKAGLAAMRWGTVHDASALNDVRRAAEYDPDPGVRRSALEVLVRYDETPEGRALLERLAEGGDEAFRELSKEHLRRMDEEAAASTSDRAEVNE